VLDILVGGDLSDVRTGPVGTLASRGLVEEVGARAHAQRMAKGPI
jgi:hypothetical protein